MATLHRFLAFLFLLCLTACGAVVTVRVELPERAPSATLAPSASPTSTATLTPSPTASPTQGAPDVTTLVNLNLRSAATINSSILTVIPAQTVIQLFGRSADSAWLSVQYQDRRGWVSSADNLVRINRSNLANLPIVSPSTPIPTLDPTPTRETARIGFNINGEAIPDINVLLREIQSPCKTLILVMNNLTLAVRIKELCPDTIVVSRNYSRLEGGEWESGYAALLAQWQREGHREIVRHSSNEPSFGSANIARFVNAEIDFMRQARANGFTVAMGNFSVGIVQASDIQSGVFDSYIRAIAQYGHYLGLHEYAVAALPYGVGQWQTSALLDRNRVQPASWPLAASLPTRLWNGEMPPYWYLRRGDWWLLRADAIGAPRPRILATEFGWDNLPNVKPEIEPLRSQFGLPQYFKDMRGVNTYPRLWAWYWPNWSFAQAVCEQLRWANSIYPSDYIGFALFTWSLSPDWRQTDFSGRENPAMVDVHSCV